MSLPDSRKIRLILDLRSNGVIDPDVLASMENLPRELFVPETFRDKAYDDVTLPIGHQQTISRPTTVGLMTQALQLNTRLKVLEIGTGSGYQAAVLAPLCRRLYTVERIGDLFRSAVAKFDELGFSNITAIQGDGSLGWPEQAPFDRIIITAAAEDMPGAVLDQLAIGGVMVVPVGFQEGGQRLWRVTRTEDGEEVEDLGPTHFVPLRQDG